MEIDRALKTKISNLVGRVFSESFSGKSEVNLLRTGVNLEEQLRTGLKEGGTGGQLKKIYISRRNSIPGRKEWQKEKM